MSTSVTDAHRAALASLDGVGPARLRWLLSGRSPEQAWIRVVKGELPPAPELRIDATLRHKWRSAASRIDPLGLGRRCDELGITVSSPGGPSYPADLVDDIDPPPLLFSLGSPQMSLPHIRVAIVGTRRSTGYGVRVAQRLAATLSGRGICIVSGLALGIDAAAHRGALEGAAPPLAVAGAGLDAPCPSRNRRLAAEIAQRGWVISEVPPGCGSAPWRFPVRNRIIAALSHAVVVVESAGTGGSLHTAREALDRDVPVLAVPGPIDSRSSLGTNELIADGAQPCLRADDVLVALGLHAGAMGDPPLPLPGLDSAATAGLAPGPVPAPGSPSGQHGESNVGGRSIPRVVPVGVEASVLAAVGWTPVSIERIASELGLGFAELSRSVASLESTGWIRRDASWIERTGDEQHEHRPDG